MCLATNSNTFVPKRNRLWQYSHMSEIADQLASEALKPQSVSNDGVSVSRRALSELIAYENHLAAKTAAASPAAMFRGMNCKIVAPGGR